MAAAKARGVVDIDSSPSRPVFGVWLVVVVVVVVLGGRRVRDTRVKGGEGASRLA